MRSISHITKPSDVQPHRSVQTTWSSNATETEKYNAKTDENITIFFCSKESISDGHCNELEQNTQWLQVLLYQAGTLGSDIQSYDKY